MLIEADSIEMTDGSPQQRNALQWAWQIDEAGLMPTIPPRLFHFRVV